MRVKARATVDGSREERRATVHGWLIGGAAAIGFTCCCEKSEGKRKCEVMKEEEKETRTNTYRNQKIEGDGLGYRVSELIKTIWPGLMWLLPHPALLRYTPAWTLVQK